MGLLTEGQPMSWEDTRQYSEHVRQHGIKQFINLYNRHKNRTDPSLKWGDEIEYMIVKFDHNNTKVRLNLKAKEILEIMDKREKDEGENRQMFWRTEWGSYMLEATPGHPFGVKESDVSPVSHILEVETNMKLRRKELNALLAEDEALLCITSFPMLGTNDCTHPFSRPNPISSKFMKSAFLGDEVFCQTHPRYGTVARNLRSRRGSKLRANAPIFRDTNTLDPFIEVFADEESVDASLPDHIYFDCQAFSMGLSCLQLTMLGANIDEARHLYDQLANICPIAMALSAASPIHRGYLTDVDCRWGIGQGANDDRTKEERGETPLKYDKFRIYKSRYDTISTYLCESNDKYNDIPLTYNKEYYNELISAGIDPMLAKHIAHLFIRDSMVLYHELIEQDDEMDTDHFEVNDNMHLAQKRNAINRCKFWFRKDINSQNCHKENVESFECNEYSNSNCDKDCDKSLDESCVLMTINEIINGNGKDFPGLVPLIRRYLESLEVDVESGLKIDQYLNLISNRASGAVKTTAQWIRDFVRQHNDYKYDSVVNDRISYDLLIAINKIQNRDPINNNII